jgi:YggT family protein
MSTPGVILSYLVSIYLAIVILRVVLDWIPPLDSAVLRKLTLYAHILTEPLLSPLRRVLPQIPLGEAMALDLSPFILTILLIVLQRIIVKIF